MRDQKLDRLAGAHRASEAVRAAVAGKDRNALTPEEVEALRLTDELIASEHEAL